MPTIPRPALAAAALAALLLPAVAAAKPPDPRFSSVEPVVYGSAAGDRAYRVNIRDVANTPITGHVVTLDFSQSPVRLYTAQEAGTSVNCTNRTLARFSDVTRTALFHPRFGGGCTEASVVVDGEGVWLAHVPARSTDIDGMNGCTDLHDFAVFAGPFLDGSDGHSELDFDGSGGRVGLGDFARLAHDLLVGAKGEYCP